jgi:MFS family permease
VNGRAGGDRRASLGRSLRRLPLDVTPLRESRDFRLLMVGQLVSGLGTQIALVALPFQIFVLSHSAALVGLLGAFELAPMIVASLLGGAVADRLDRRKVLIAAQFGIIATAAVLAVVTLAARPPVLAILVIGGLLAGSSALDAVTRAAIIPRVVPPARLRSALAFNYGTYQLTGIVGPAVGGILIAAIGIGAGYLIDAGSCLAMVTAALALSPQAPALAGGRSPVLRSIGEGLRFVAHNQALAGSFAIDLVAMTFGWPRSMFAVLSLTVYHSGARGTGLLFAALAVGGTLSILTAGWIEHARRLGRIVIVVVVLWGAAIAGAGLVRSLGPALVLLARRIRGRGQRRLPLDHQPDRHSGSPPRPDERVLQLGRHRRTAARGHRVGTCGRSDLGGNIAPDWWVGVHRRGRSGRRGVPGAGQI